MSTTLSLPISTATELESLVAIPLIYSLALKTWFKPEALKKAHTLLQKRKTAHLLFFRHSAARVQTDGITATVNIVAGKGKHTYVFRDGWCSQCIAGKAGKTGHQCHHVAALAMLCLQLCNGKLHPITMSFADSLWQKIGCYLCDRFALGQTKITWAEHSEHLQLSVNLDSDLSLLVAVHPAAACELQGLGVISKDDTPSHLNDSLEPLAAHLAQMTATENEQAFLRRGSTSKQLHRDQSCWMWLARFLFLHLPETGLSINHHESGRFVIQSSGEKPLFQLILPRHNSWELLGQLDLESHGFKLLPPAEQFNLVGFSDDGNAIQVENCCRLLDGTQYTLASLEERRFGSRYFLDNCFFSLASLSAEERIDEKKKKILSLLTCQPKITRKTWGSRSRPMISRTFSSITARPFKQNDTWLKRISWSSM